VDGMRTLICKLMAMRLSIFQIQRTPALAERPPCIAYTAGQPTSIEVPETGPCGSIMSQCLRKLLLAFSQFGRPKQEREEPVGPISKLPPVENSRRAMLRFPEDLEQDVHVRTAYK
jgi:hypothetical protein